jgi:hypothetical protein
MERPLSGRSTDRRIRRPFPEYGGATEIKMEMQVGQMDFQVFAASPVGQREGASRSSLRRF